MFTRMAASAAQHTRNATSLAASVMAQAHWPRTGRRARHLTITAAALAAFIPGGLAAASAAAPAAVHHISYPAPTAWLVAPPGTGWPEPPVSGDAARATATVHAIHTVARIKAHRRAVRRARARRLAAIAAAAAAAQAAQQQASQQQAAPPAVAGPVTTTPAAPTPPPATGGVLTPDEVGQFWLGAGGPASAELAAEAVAMCESGDNPGAFNPSGATGLWQILGAVVPGDLTDPAVNAANAVAKFEASGDTWAQWVCQP
jgi:hypothetical protein